MAESKTQKEIILGLGSNDTEFAYKCLAEIRQTYVTNLPKMKKLCSRHDVMKCVIQHLEHPRLCSIALSIISNSCMDNSLRHQVVKNKGIPPLVRILRGLANGEILNRACRALGNIALTERGLSLVLEAKPVGSIVSFLTSADLKDYQMTAVRTLRILGRYKKRHNMLVKEKAIYAIARLLSKEEKDLVKCSVKALALLLHNCNSETARQMKEAESIPILVNLYSTDTDANIRDNALSCLENLTQVSEIRRDLGEAGACKIFIDVATEQQFKHRTQGAVLALCFCCEEYLERIRIRESGGLLVLNDILKLEDFENIHIYVIIAVLKLSREISDIKESYISQIMPVVMKKLKSFIDKNRSEHVANKRPSSSYKKRSEVYKEELLSFASQFVLDVKDSKNKVEEASMSPKSSRVSDTVFSIHSPTYQGVQYSEPCNASGSQSSYASFASPLGSTAQCNSPDQYSFEWSPGSPASCSSMYSPFSSGSPTSVNACWSPVCSSRSHSPDSSKEDNDDFSGSYFNESAENPKPDKSNTLPSGTDPTVVLNNDVLGEQSGICNISNKSNNLIAFSCEPQIVPNTAGPCNFTLSKELFTEAKHSISEYSVSAKRHKTESNDAENCVLSQCIQSISELCSREKPGASTKSEADKGVDVYIFLMFSHLIRQFERAACSFFAEEENFSILLKYVSLMSCPNPRAVKVLKSLASSHLGFHKLIINDFVGQIDKIMSLQHKAVVCDRCTEIDSAKSELLVTLRCVTVTYCEKSNLKHNILSPNVTHQLRCLYAVSRLFVNKIELCEMLYKTKGMLTLLDFLSLDDGKFYTTSALALSHIWRTLHRIVSEDPSYSLSEVYCRYMFMSNDNSFDVTVLTDDGMKTQGVKAQLCGRSDYFDRLLAGQFLEATQDVVSISFVNSRVLLYIMHVMHGCLYGWCPFITKAPLEIMLQAIDTADLLLLTDLKKELQERVLKEFDMKSAEKLYTGSKLHGSQKYLDSVLCHTLYFGFTNQTDYFSCLRDLLELHKEELLKYINSTMNKCYNQLRYFPTFR